MEEVPDFINKNKYTHYVKGSLSSQLQKTIFLNSTGVPTVFHDMWGQPRSHSGLGKERNTKNATGF